MLSDLVEVLRCPSGHANGYLVASVTGRAGRYVVSGSLACPQCRTHWEIRNHRAELGGVPTPTASATPPSDASLVRLAAQLDLRTPGGYVLLPGGWAAHAVPLAAAYDVHCVVLNAPRTVDPGEGASFVDAITVPLAAATLRGAVLDAGWAADAAFAPALIASLRTAARVVAPAAVPVPDALQLVARDDREWVATLPPPATPPVILTRAVC